MLQRAIRILLVEDEPYEVQAIKDYLKNLPNYKLVGIADNDEDAMQLVIDQKPDVIILDFTLKGSVGSDLIRNVRKSEIAVQPFILVVSSSIEAWKKEELLNIGANECLIKGKILNNPPLFFNYINDFFPGYLKRIGQEAQLTIEVESNTEIKCRLEQRIGSDLQCMGYVPHQGAYHYTIEIIQTCVTDKVRRPFLSKFYREIAKNTGCLESTIKRAVENGIIRAFSADFYEETRKFYTAEYGKNKDRPSPLEFVGFFINKYIEEGY